MKELKFFLANLFTTILTCSWWAATLWGHDKKNDAGQLETCFFFLWILAVFFTIIMIISVWRYLFDHWNDR